ncbi:MAG: T9SS type A sorting domain-containing protein [Chitinophagaceae bacterium]|nr:T9SS type A sorting domain-containing protein [Chitinophagaceae bacterium]
MTNSYLSFATGVLLLLTTATNAQNKIKYYFNKPVNTSVSKGVNAQYLNNCMGDTVVAYINRSKYTLDIAVYNYTSTFPAIATAVNNAHARGVRVRWIYDSSSSNTGIPLLNGAINRTASPDASGSYNIMHNKFMIIDANSSNPADAIVWTGSSNWNSQQFNSDYNNAVVIQDQALAKAYRAHFNMMWGDTGLVPNKTLAKFGPDKTDLGNHIFTIEGKTVELYFSPSDGVNNKILSALNTANTDLYVGMSTFTYNSDASAMVSKKSAGVYVACIGDGSSTSSSVSSALTSGLGSTFISYPGPVLYHNKFMIVDASNKCSDPLVLTGSHNWTVSADTKNDENTLIIHDDTAANIYYQSFHANFTSMGGSLSSITDCITETETLVAATPSITITPNPANGVLNINYSIVTAMPVSIEIFDSFGRLATRSYLSDNEPAGHHRYSVALPNAGVYLVRVTTPLGTTTAVATSVD